MVGLAVDAKPWAVGFAGVLLLLPSLRSRLRALMVVGITVGAAWLPFVIGDPDTVRAMRFTIPNTDLSALRALGIHDARTPPWDRPAQAVLALALTTLAVYRRRWAAAILIAVAARLVLDPGTNIYYLAGLAVGAALWDVVGSRRTVPWWTLSVCLGLFAARSMPVPPPTHGWLMITYFLACCGLVCLPRGAGDAGLGFSVRSGLGRHAGPSDRSPPVLE